MLIAYLRTYNSLQPLTSYIGGCELPKKCIAIVLVNV
jgi:hypothetical protein